tara:strand:- start:8843 stop:10114 length:1272 start_codon:yes stop_codon:yes gene_type:complete
MNILFLSDTLSDNDLTKKVFLEYLKITPRLDSNEFFENIEINYNDIPQDKYLVFYDTFHGIQTFENKFNDENLFNRIVNDCRQGRCRIVFFQTDCWGGGYGEEDTWKNFRKLIEKHNLNMQSFGFVFYESVLKDDRQYIIDDLDYTFFNRNAVFTYYPDSWILSKSMNTNALKSIFNNSGGYYRQFKYASHNNNIKDHRVELMLTLIKNNLLEDGITTWFGGREPDEQGVNDLNFNKYKTIDRGIIDYSEDYGQSTVELANKLVPDSYDYKIDGLQDYLNVIPYFNCYFNIVTESVWGPGYDNTRPQKIHLTEKVWKCMITYQPFILISNKNNLKKLKEWGFKTFHPFINESYDDLETYEERKKLIEKEIVRLCSMSREDLDKWYWNMREILIHNAEHFNKFINNEYNKLQKFLKKSFDKIDG